MRKVGPEFEKEDERARKFQAQIQQCKDRLKCVQYFQFFSYMIFSELYARGTRTKSYKTKGERDQFLKNDISSLKSFIKTNQKKVLKMLFLYILS